MTENHPAQNDRRSIDELLGVAREMDDDDDEYWDAIWALQWRGTREVLDRAALLAGSESAAERRVGADILAQLGSPDRTYPQECVAVLLELLESEVDAEVLCSVLTALGHHRAPQAIPAVARFTNHLDSDIRYAVVSALTGHEDELAVDLLIELMDDLDSDVRDWATFGLGTILNLDTSQIRQALAARLDDSDIDARGEAIKGLAKRKDLRAIPAIIAAMETDCKCFALEAIEFFGSLELLPKLVALRNAPHISQSQLESAIQACSSEVQ